MSGKHEKDRLFAENALPHADTVYRFALHLCGDDHEAQDLSQECFHQAYRKFHQFQNGTNCKAWLLRITRNAHIDRLRQRRREPKSSELQEVAAPAENGGTILDWDHLARDGQESLYALFGDEVRQSLEELPEDFRLAVLLCDVEGFSYQEIGEILGCPVGTVRSRISRSRSHLKRRLQDYAQGLGFLKKAETG